MKKKEDKVEVTEAPKEYIRLVKTASNMYSVETVYVIDDKIIKVDASEPAYLPIAFDRMRRKTADSFFSVIKE